MCVCINKKFNVHWKINLFYYLLRNMRVVVGWKLLKDAKMEKDAVRKLKNLVSYRLQAYQIYKLYAYRAPFSKGFFTTLCSFILFALILRCSPLLFLWDLRWNERRWIEFKILQKPVNHCRDCRRSRATFSVYYI